MQATQAFSLAVFNSATPYTQPINQSSSLSTWSTSGTNRITLGTQEFGFASSIKFKNMRVYTDLTTVVHPEAPFGQMKLYCQSNCLTCSDVECESCEAGFYVNACVCRACSIYCLTCSRAGANACLSCTANLLLTKEGSCETTCHEGTFAENSRCMSCPPDCKACINSNECTACLDTLYQLETNNSVSCLQECPAGFFAEQKACSLCDASCKTCTGPTKTDCSECAEGYVLVGDECSQCTANAYYFDGLNCVACEASCDTCSLSGVRDSCVQGLTLNSGRLCGQADCEVGFYLGETGCYECHCELCEDENT
jgi:proprotein convertase subtilisin/kexin type 5